LASSRRRPACPRRTIRYYEDVGVLPRPSRTPAGYRQYAQQGVHRLRFIRRARALGLPLQHLKALAAVLDGGPRATVRPRLLVLVRAQLTAVHEQITELQLLQEQLEQVLHHLLTRRAPNHDEACRCLDCAGLRERNQPLAWGTDNTPPQERFQNLGWFRESLIFRIIVWYLRLTSLHQRLLSTSMSWRRRP